MTNLPEVYYGLHMSPGVAEYRPQNSDPFRILINEETIKNMGETFPGRPVYVDHVDDVDLSKLREQADGYVVEAFFNKADGKHWVKFIVVSEEGKKAIKSGYLLSNAYIPKSFAPGGIYQGVEYAKEVTSGEYEHLALVKVPRYQSKILTPEEFKEYNREKEIELQKLANSQDERKTSMKLDFWKRTKVENAGDLENTVVVLPKSKKEKTIAQLVNEMDEMQNNEGKPMIADAKHMVKLHDGSDCTVGELLEKHKAMHDELESMKKNAEKTEHEEELEEKEAPLEVEGDKHNDESEDESAKEKAEELVEHEEKEIKEKKQNEADAKKAKGKESFKKVTNAESEAAKKLAAIPSPKIEMLSDRVARGKSRYGRSS